MMINFLYPQDLEKNLETDRKNLAQIDLIRESGNYGTTNIFP
jgi:hypothetical protein